MSLDIGGTVRLRTMRDYRSTDPKAPGIIHMDYTAPEGRVFVVLLLGTEPRYPKDDDEILKLDETLASFISPSKLAAVCARLGIEDDPS